VKRRAISYGLRFRVIDRDRSRCVYCGRHSTEIELHIDHVTPVADGGDNDFWNLVTSCLECNLGKSARKTAFSVVGYRIYVSRRDNADILKNIADNSAAQLKASSEYRDQVCGAALELPWFRDAIARDVPWVHSTPHDAWMWLVVEAVDRRLLAAVGDAERIQTEYTNNGGGAAG